MQKWRLSIERDETRMKKGKIFSALILMVIMITSHVTTSGIVWNENVTVERQGFLYGFRYAAALFLDGTLQ